VRDPLQIFLPLVVVRLLPHLMSSAKRLGSKLKGLTALSGAGGGNWFYRAQADDKDSTSPIPDHQSKYVPKAFLPSSRDKHEI